MINKLSSYFETWWEIVSAPILFYTILEKESWKEKSLNFLVITSWFLSFALTIVIFIAQLYPIGKTLVEGITGLKLLIVSPIIIAVALMFFTIIFVILGGFSLFALFAAFYAVGYLLHFISKALGGEGEVTDMLQSVFYSSATLLFFLFSLIFIILVDQGIFSYDIFKTGHDVVYYLSCLFIYGLWSIAVRKTGGHSKARSFLIALVPFLILIIIGIIFDLKGFEKIRPILGA